MKLPPHIKDNVEHAARVGHELVSQGCALFRCTRCNATAFLDGEPQFYASCKPRFTYEPGRNIYVDGHPLISINREGETIPTIADAFASLIVDLLNGSDEARAILAQKVRRK